MRNFSKFVEKFSIQKIKKISMDDFSEIVGPNSNEILKYKVFLCHILEGTVGFQNKVLEDYVAKDISNLEKKQIFFSPQ